MGVRVESVTEHCQMSCSGSRRCKAGDKRLDAALATCGVAKVGSPFLSWCWWGWKCSLIYVSMLHGFHAVTTDSGYVCCGMLTSCASCVSGPHVLAQLTWGAGLWRGLAGLCQVAKASVWHGGTSSSCWSELQPCGTMQLAVSLSWDPRPEQPQNLPLWLQMELLLLGSAEVHFLLCSWERKLCIKLCTQMALLQALTLT